MSDANHTIEKKCPRCSKVFSCVAHDQCWCEEEIQLNRETLKKLRLSYIDCLCKECLLYFKALEKHGEQAA